MPVDKSKDRRRDIRVPKKVPVVILSGEFEGIFMETEDISLGGTSVRLDRPLKIGTEFVLQFHLPTAGMPIEVKGRITAVKENHEIGIQFLDLDSEAEMEIWNYMISKD